MDVFRLTREKYAHELSGRGAAIKGARWNPVGIDLIYTASNRSLAMAEVAVHLTLATMPPDFKMMTIKIPEKVSRWELNIKSLPLEWKDFPHPASTQEIGRDFVLQCEYCLMIVPSVITPGDYNVLINPHHPDFAMITIDNVEDFLFDRRILKF